MKRVILFFLLLSIVSYAVLTLGTHPGRLIIQFEQYSIETSLIFACFFLVLFLLLLLLCCTIISKVLNSYNIIGSWRQRLRPEKINSKLIKIIAAILDDNWDSAAKLSNYLLKYSKHNLTFSLLAAFCNSKVDLNTTNIIISNASTTQKKHRYALTILHAWLNYKQHKYQQSIEIINKLSSSEQQQKDAIAIKIMAHAAMTAWPQISSDIAKIKSLALISNSEQEEIITAYHYWQLNNCEDPVKYYLKLPLALQQQPKFAKHYIKQLEQNNKVQKAINTLKTIIPHNWNYELLKKLVSLNHMNGHDTLKQLLKWSKQQPNIINIKRAISYAYSEEKMYLKALENYLCLAKNEINNEIKIDLIYYNIKLGEITKAEKLAKEIITIS